MTEMSARADVSSCPSASVRRLACLLEVSAPKPGNVHRGADFEDMTFVDFAISAVAIAPAHGATPCVAEWAGRCCDAIASHARSGRYQHESGNRVAAGSAGRRAARRAAPTRCPAGPGLARRRATARIVYDAIRQAQPGGLGQVEAMDVAAAAPADLLAAMQAASDRDLVARQYVTGLPRTGRSAALAAGRPWTGLVAGRYDRAHAIAVAESIRRQPDRAQVRPGRLAAGRGAGQPGCSRRACRATADYDQALADLDFWLRSDHHRRNPGTTADLIAAGLFAALRDGLLHSPFLNRAH